MVFTQADGLKEHYDLYHQDKKTFNCDSCVKAFATKPLLDVHIRGVHKYAEKCENCDYCTATYKTRKSLLKHILQEHKNRVASFAKFREMQKTILKNFAKIRCEKRRNSSRPISTHFRPELVQKEAYSRVVECFPLM